MMNRRRFLQALGLGAASPLLMPLIRYVSANDSAPLARRFVIVVEGNGIEPVNFLSQPTRAYLDGLGGSVGAKRVFTNHYDTLTGAEVVRDADLASAPSLAGLGELAQKSMVLLGLSSTITGGGHSSVYGALGCMRSAGIVPAGETVDHTLASMSAVRGTAQGRGISPFDAFRAGIGRSGQAANGLCARGQGDPAPIFMSQHAAYSHLFGSVAGGDAGRRYAMRNKMLDYSRRDINRALKTFSGSSPERAKLEAYLSAVEDLEQRQLLLSSQAWAPRLQQVKPPGPGEPPREGMPGFETTKPMERLGLHFDMATAALLGGLTNVAVLGSGVAGGLSLVYETIDAPAGVEEHERHKICHIAYSSGGDPYAEYLRRISARHVDLIARMARTLEATPEGDGTSMLDHTVILYMSDNGEKHHASGKEWPMLLVGGGALGFQTDNRTVLHPSHGSQGYRQVSNLFNTFGHAAGDETLNTFGQESASQRQAQGPLSELVRKA